MIKTQHTVYWIMKTQKTQVKKSRVSAATEEEKPDIPKTKKQETVELAVKPVKTEVVPAPAENADKQPTKTPVKKSTPKKEPAPVVPAIDVEAIKKELYSEIRKQVEFEFKRQQHVDEATTKAHSSITRSELTLAGEKEYKITSDIDGLNILEKDVPLFSINKSGVVGVGIKAPRGFGRGSMHIRSNYSSEAAIPTTGDNSTRGLIVEGDGDDHKTFTFRVLSRMNRQGINVTGDGSLIVGLANDYSESKLTVYQPINDEHATHIHAPSKYYNANILDLETKALNNKTYNFIDARREAEANNDYINSISAFRVDGTGTVFADSGFVSNHTGYAEYFEWEDNNTRSEDRLGFTVSLTKKGQIRPANEGDVVIGVVVSNSAIIGNAAWNAWRRRWYLDPFLERRRRKYQVMEWQTHDNLSQSFINGELPKDYPIPENCINYETGLDGQDLYMDHMNDMFDKTIPYANREYRNFPLVRLIGRTVLFKGQVVNKNWIKVRDISDELEEWIIK